MKIIDISQEITKCNVYPGDPIPKVLKVSDMNNGELYNLSEFKMCAHNGTHVDAPSHFIKNGKSIDQISLDRFVGWCYVSSFDGELKQEDAKQVLNTTLENNCLMILIKGDCIVTSSAAKVFSESNILLIGNESQSVGPIDSPMEVHKILLEKEIVLLEGINLKDVSVGKYFLCAQPLNINGIEGSPCRAILIKE